MNNIEKFGNEEFAVSATNFFESALSGSIDKEFTTSIDTSTEDGALKLLKVSDGEPDAKFSDYIGKQITFTDFYMEKVTIEDTVKKGKMIDTIRTVVITPDGDIISGTSEGLAKSVLMIIRCLGMPSKWQREYWFEVRQIETRHGRRYFKLQIVEDFDD